MKDTKKKSLISLDDLTPKEKVQGGADRGKRIFGSFSDINKKNKSKDSF